MSQLPKGPWQTDGHTVMGTTPIDDDNPKRGVPIIATIHAGRVVARHIVALPELVEALEKCVHELAYLGAGIANPMAGDSEAETVGTALLARLGHSDDEEKQ